MKIEVCDSSTEQSKSFNCMVNISEYLEENQGIASIFTIKHAKFKDQMSLSLHLIHCRMWSDPDMCITLTGSDLLDLDKM